MKTDSKTRTPQRVGSLARGSDSSPTLEQVVKAAHKAGARVTCSLVSREDEFLSLLATVVEAERLIVEGLKPDMPCRKMHENRHRAFREALSMATAFFHPNNRSEPTARTAP